MAPSLNGFLKMNCHHKFRPSSPYYMLSLLIIFHFNPEVTANNPVFLGTLCPTHANYTAGSAFNTNLNLLLSSLSSTAAAAVGFYNDTIGQPPNRVYGLALCQGDISLVACQVCLIASVTEITRSCPKGMRSAIWYDICWLRYSNTSFFSTADNSIQLTRRNSNNASDLQNFNDKLGNLMNSLATKAAYSSSKMFAAGNVSLTSLTKIFGLVQCTRDLYADDCYNCIAQTVGSIPSFCMGKQGCKLLGVSCGIRYEIYPFFNISATQAISPPPSSTLVSPPPLLSRAGNEGNSNNQRTVLFIIIAVAAAAAV